MLHLHAINSIGYAPPAWLAADPAVPEEHAQPMEDFIYHRPVLQKEVLELLKP